jgi:predicted nuclease of restriction endonuclease-like (RecB) superfamily
MSSLIKTDVRYRKWITAVSKRFRQSQLKAAVKVNDEMLRFYWGLGRDISLLSKEADYGSNFYKTISGDLKDVFPDIKSFSPTNLKYMRYFYEMYPDIEIRQQTADALTIPEDRPQLVDGFDQTENRPQPVDDLEMIFYIPWGHNRMILDKCKGNPEKALFYVKKTLENNWSRAVLMNFLDADLYERQGKAITNFSLTLPAEQSELAQAITKDPYNFDFISIREKYDEKELKDALMDNIERFLMELGNGFAYAGREVELNIGKTENFIDLLFYNYKLHCFVVIEVKIGEFKSADMGQLGTYMVAVNHQMKGEKDEPTLGLIICKSRDSVKARYALEASSQPMGIAVYDINRFLPEDYRSSLPTIEEIEAELADEVEGGQPV